MRFRGATERIMGKGSRSRFSSSTSFSPLDDLVMQHQPNRLIRDIPRRQTQAQRPTVHVLFQRKGEPAQLISLTHREYGYRLIESADHWGVHAGAVSRRLTQAEQATVLCGQNLNHVPPTFSIRPS